MAVRAVRTLDDAAIALREIDDKLNSVRRRLPPIVKSVTVPVQEPPLRGSGITITVPLAKLAVAQGSLTIVNGIITKVVLPT